MQFLNSQTLFVAAKGQGISRDDVLLHVDNTDSTLLHLAVESGVAKVGREYFPLLLFILCNFNFLSI